MADIVIIGAGRLGTSLGRALAVRGHTVKAVTCRTPAEARESRKIIGQGKSLADNAAAAGSGDVIFLCLPDEEIPAAAASLARARLDWPRKTVFHTSGLLSSDALLPLQKKGASIASFHPVQSFARKKTPPSYFQGVYFGIEGDKKACRRGAAFARDLGGHPFLLPAKGKPAYHAACSIASGFLVVLLDAASTLLSRAGIEEKTARGLLFPLVEGTLQNVKKLDTSAALTGPLARGDAASVRKHLRALRTFPEFAAAYRALSFLALKRAEKSGLPRHKIRALKNLLGGK